MKKNIIMLLFFIGFVAACGTSQKSNPSEVDSDTNRDSTQSDQPIEIMKPLEGVEYYLSINKEQFSLKDEIKVNATVKNVSNEPVEYIGYNGCDDGVHTIVSISKHQTRLLQANYGEEVMGCTEAIEHHNLEPGEKITEEKVFVPRMNLGLTKKVEVPTGEYPVQLIFQRGDLESNQARNPQVEINIHIDGGEKIVTKEEAINIAQEHEEVQSWLSNRNGQSVTKEEDGKYYVMDRGNWQKAAKQLYDRMEDYKPESNIQFVENQWVMTYIDKVQGPPHRLEVYIDPKSAEVAGVNKLEK